MASRRTALKQAGLKTTRPRLKVLSVLGNSAVRHMAAEEVYKILLGDEQSIGLGTVYRVLTQLEDAGLVIRHNFGERAVFELNDESHHDHMVCIVCGGVTEFFDQRIEEQQEKVAKKHGFVIHDHALTFYGKCKNCADDAAGGAPAVKPAPNPSLKPSLKSPDKSSAKPSPKSSPKPPTKRAPK